MAITPLPVVPLRSDAPATFVAKADAFLGSLNLFATEVDAVGVALTLGATNATSTTSLLIGLGSKSLTVPTGKSYVAGMTLKIASTASPTNWMLGDITSYVSGTGALVVNVIYTGGSGTLAAWTLSQSVAATGDATLSSINGGQLAGFRNRIINGSMQIAQRGSTISVPANFSANFYTADRWLVSVPNVAITANTTQAFGTAQAIQILNGASLQNIFVYQRIEADNCYDMAGKTVTFSAELSASAASYTISVYRAVSKDTWGTWGSTTSVLVSTQTVTVSGNLCSAQFAIPASGNLGLQVVISFVGLPASATAYVGRTQFEIGSVATPFEQRPYGMELALCQRYYWQQTNVIFTTGFYRAGTTSLENNKKTLPVPMRITPNCTAASPTGTVYTNGSSAALTSISAATADDNTQINLDIVTSASTQGLSGWFHLTSTLTASAEL